MAKVGHFKISRSIEDWPYYFSEPFSRVHAWIDLIFLARYDEEPSFFFVRGNKIEIKRGQLAWSREALAKRWKWSRKKVENFLKTLEMEQQITQQKSFTLSVITIVNYNKHQPKGTAEEQQKSSRRAAEEHIIKKVNEGKERKEYNSLRTEFAEYVDFYEKKSGRKVKALDIRRKKFESRRKSFSLEEIKEATTAILSDAFLQGDNDRGKAFGDIDFILRNDQQIEKNLKINQTTCIPLKAANVIPPSALSIEL